MRMNWIQLPVDLVEVFVPSFEEVQVFFVFLEEILGQELWLVHHTSQGVKETQRQASEDA